MELPIVFEDEDSVVFKIGNTLVNFLDEKEGDELITPAKVALEDAGSRFVLTMQVEDLDGKCAELKARGIEWITEPIDRSWGVRTANFRDPDGHIWELAMQI